MPSLFTRLAAAAVLAALNFIAIGPAQAQQVNPSIGAGVSVDGLGNIGPAVGNLACRTNPRACRSGPSAQQRDPGTRPDRNQQGGGPRPGRR